VVVATTLTAILLVFGWLNWGLDLGRLFTFSNHSGIPAKPNSVWPWTDNIVWLFLLGMLLPAYTLSSFDSAAQTAEETIDAPRVVPRGILRAVIASGLAGWIFLSAVVLAIPDMKEAVDAGPLSFFVVIRRTTPYWLHFPIYLGLGLAQFHCGLAILTSASRMAFAFARDGGLPLSRASRRISPTHHTPSVAIWTIAGPCRARCNASVYGRRRGLRDVSVPPYVLPTTLGLFAHGRTWTRMGPWHLGRWYRPLAGVCVAGCVLLFIIGIQPLNDIAIWIMGGSFLTLIVLWFGYMRRRFPGPPESILAILRPAEIPVEADLPAQP
jgi:amino acid transporter